MTPSPRRLLLLAIALLAPLLAFVPASPAGAAADPPALGPGPAYWLVASDGGIFAYGRAHFAGSLAGTPVQRPIAGIAATPSGQGYWMVARDGGVFAFGDAPYLGGAAGQPLNTAVVGIAPTPSGHGYWLASADGGVFAYGDAPFLGGLPGGGAPLNQPVVALAATPSGKGYWLIARDGGVFAYGDAPYLGGPVGGVLNRGIVGMAASVSGRGYWLVAADGGVFAYGDAGFAGSALGAAPASPIVGMARTRSGGGYWLVASDGGVFAYGDAGFFGSPADGHVNGRVVAVAAGVGVDVHTQPRELSGTFGWDISWPQCRSRLPQGGYAFAVVGVTGGRQFTANPCLAEQWRWTLRGGSVGAVYMNVNWPSRDEEPSLPQRMADACPITDVECQAYQWGRRGAIDALAVATRAGANAPMWWIDVETTNRWSPDQGLNSLVVYGAIDGLRAAGRQVGAYSTQYQWNVIVGDFAPAVPTWVAGPSGAADAPPYCNPDHSFGGGKPWLVQYPNGLDGNLLCPEGARQLMTSFQLPPPPAVPVFPIPPPVPFS
ncbi:MAG TPA: hypothetical protein VFA94_08845 [Acidimicrobiales bacterium]|nr:hypothetical protein [Acidimicrobiales bacterium]